MQYRKKESSWCKHLYMYHKMRLLVFGDNMEKQMDFPVEDSQDYFRMKMMVLFGY